MATVGVGLVVFFAASAGFVGALWLLTELIGDEHREIQIAAAFVFGLAFLFSIVSSMVAAFAALNLTSSRSALGLPEGSIRAIIALVLVVIFVIMAVYLVEAVFTQDTTTEAQSAATQLLATVGTLVAAVAAFYFGTSAVTTGAAAVTAAAAAGRAVRPAAITKGSALRGDTYWLVGIVNPNGLETNWYFQYGEDLTYGSQTAVAHLGAGDAETLVEVEVPDIKHGWHFRIVAFSESGTSYGDDAVVTDLPAGAEAQDGGPGPEGGEPQAEGEEEVAEEEEPAIVEEEQAIAQGQEQAAEGEEAVAQAEAEIAEVEEQVAAAEEAIAEGEAEVAEEEEEKEEPSEGKRRRRRQG